MKNNYYMLIYTSRLVSDQLDFNYSYLIALAGILNK